jgi:hypothetical protein
MIYAVICLEANFLTWCPTTSLSSAISSGLCNISHVGNASLPFSCVLQFSSDPASLVRSFALDVLLRLLPSHHHLRTSLTMSTQSPPLTRKPTSGSSQGVHSSLLYHLQWIDGAHGNVCVPSAGGLDFTTPLALHEPTIP